MCIFSLGLQKEKDMEKLIRINERKKYEVQKLLPDNNSISRLALYFQNFSDETRIKILSCLSIMDMCVNDIASTLNINQTTISHQLKTLKDQGIVEYRREGKVLVYRLKASGVGDIMMYAISGVESARGF